MPLFGEIVVIKRNGSDGTHFPLTATTCLFGRKTECDIRIQLPHVSKEHCKVEVKENKEVFATNLSTVNPTQLNGKAIQQPVRLKHGDVLTIIDRSFRFEEPRSKPVRRRSTGLGTNTYQVSTSEQSSSIDETVRVETPKTSKRLRRSEGSFTKMTHNRRSLQISSSKDNKDSSPFSELYEMFKSKVESKKAKSPLKQAEDSPRNPKSESILPSANNPQPTVTSRRSFRRSQASDAYGETPAVVESPDVSNGRSEGARSSKSLSEYPPSSIIENKHQLAENTDAVGSAHTNFVAGNSGGEAQKKLRTPERSSASKSHSSQTPSSNSTLIRYDEFISMLGREEKGENQQSPKQSLNSEQAKSTTNASSPSNRKSDVLSPHLRKRKDSASVQSGKETAESSSENSQLQHSSKSPTQGRGRRSPKDQIQKPKTVDQSLGNSDQITDLNTSPLSRRLSQKSVRNTSPKALESTATKKSPRKRRSDELALPEPPMKRKRVSFGGHLSPELFDKRLPPNSPLKRGATPARRSLSIDSPRAVIRKSFGLKHFVLQEISEMSGSSLGVASSTVAPIKRHLPEGSPSTATSVKKTPAKRSPARASPAKRSPARASPAKRSPARASPAKRSPARASPAKRSPARASPAKRSPARASPAKRSPARASPAKRSPARASPAKRSPARASPAKRSPARASPAKRSPARASPAKRSPARASPAKRSPARASPAKRSPARASPAKRSPARASPAKRSPARASPAKRSPARASPAKRSPARASPAKRSPARASPAKRSPARASPAKRSPARASPAKRSPARASPAKRSPARASPAKRSPARASPAKRSPARASPAKRSPARASPAKRSPARASPAKRSPARASPAKRSPARASPAKYTKGRFSVSRISTPPKVNDLVPGYAAHGGFTEQTPKKSRKSLTLKKTPLRRSRKLNAIEVIRSRRRSGATEANLLLAKSWADVVKSGVAKPQKTSVKPVYKVKITKKKKTKTPARKIAPTGHADSPATILIGRAHTRSLNLTGHAPKVVRNQALKIDTDPNESFTGITELFNTPLNEKQRKSTRLEKTDTPKSSVAEVSLMKTPEESGEMVVSPINSPVTTQRKKYGREAVSRLLSPGSPESLKGIEQTMAAPEVAVVLESVAVETKERTLRTKGQKALKDRRKTVDLTGIKRIMKTPKQKATSITDSVALKKLLRTPKQAESLPVIYTRRSSQFNEVVGVKRLLTTPRTRAQPVEDLTGVKRIMKTPRQKGEPVEDMVGIKRLMRTPKQRGEPVEDMVGVKRLMRTPKQRGEPVEDMVGIKRIMTTPKEKGQPVEDLMGIGHIMSTPSENTHPIEEIFGIKQLIKTPPKKPTVTEKISTAGNRMHIGSNEHTEPSENPKSPRSTPGSGKGRSSKHLSRLPGSSATDERNLSKQDGVTGDLRSLPSPKSTRTPVKLSQPHTDTRLTDHVDEQALPETNLQPEKSDGKPTTPRRGRASRSTASDVLTSPTMALKKSGIGVTEASSRNTGLSNLEAPSQTSEPASNGHITSPKRKGRLPRSQTTLAPVEGGQELSVEKPQPHDTVNDGETEKLVHSKRRGRLPKNTAKDSDVEAGAKKSTVAQRRTKRNLPPTPTLHSEEVLKSTVSEQTPEESIVKHSPVGKTVNRHTARNKNQGENEQSSDPEESRLQPRRRALSKITSKASKEEKPVESLEPKSITRSSRHQKEDVPDIGTELKSKTLRGRQIKNTGENESPSKKPDTARPEESTAITNRPQLVRRGRLARANKTVPDSEVISNEVTQTEVKQPSPSISKNIRGRRRNLYEERENLALNEDKGSETESLKETKATRGKKEKPQELPKEAQNTLQLVEDANRVTKGKSSKAKSVQWHPLVDTQETSESQNSACSIENKTSIRGRPKGKNRQVEEPIVLAKRLRRGKVEENLNPEGLVYTETNSSPDVKKSPAKSRSGKRTIDKPQQAKNVQSEGSTSSEPETLIQAVGLEVAEEKENKKGKRNPKTLQQNLPSVTLIDANADSVTNKRGGRRRAASNVLESDKVDENVVSNKRGRRTAKQSPLKVELDNSAVKNPEDTEGSVYKARRGVKRKINPEPVNESLNESVHTNDNLQSDTTKTDNVPSSRAKKNTRNSSMQNEVTDSSLSNNPVLSHELPAKKKKTEPPTATQKSGKSRSVLKTENEKAAKIPTRASTRTRK